MMSDTGGDTAPIPSKDVEIAAPLVPPDPPAAPGAPVRAALEATLDDLEKAAHLADPVEMVHDARKAMKAYRGLLRLVPTEGAKQARRETAATARALSAARDRAAALEALAELTKIGLLSAADQAAAAAAIGTDPAEDGPEAEGHRAEILAFLDAARGRLRDGLGAEAEAADVVDGLTHAYRKARKARFDTPEAMHETRKRVITHRYQMSFFAGAFAGHGAKRAVRAQALRDLLGAYQDIETLRPMVEAARDALGEATYGRLSKAMQVRQKRLRRDAVERHCKLFCHRPKRFAKACRKAV